MKLNQYCIIMKKLLFLAVVCCLPLLAYTQTSEEGHYIYNVVKLSGNLEKRGFKVKLDDGKSVKRLKDSDGNKIKFRTPAAVLTYLTSEGWELYMNGSEILGNRYQGKKGNKTESSWIIRKACTEEELDKFIEEGVKMKKPASEVVSEDTSAI